MRNLKTYLGLLLVSLMALTACQDDFDDLKLREPESSWLADQDNYDTWTIAKFKETYWEDADNYYKTVGEGADGKHILLRGRVISSDASGNIYKSLVIQDATGALAMSINQNGMSVKYRRGQEVVVDVTGMTVGKYASLQQLGAGEDSPTYGPQTTFMSYESFEEHSQLNGLPDLAAIDTLTISNLSELTGGPDVLRKWQSQMVRINDVEFENAGTMTFAESKTTVNTTVKTKAGNTMTVRTSGYSNFWSDVLPVGRGDIAGILSYHTSGGWQLLLIDRTGCMNWGHPTIGPGAEDNPYKVTEAIAAIESGSDPSQVWTTGYIVGAVAPGPNVSSNSDIQFTDSPELDNTLVIASSPDVKDYTKCLVVPLPQGSKLRQYGNLVDNKSNYGKQIWLFGNLGYVLGTYGISGNQGTTDQFRIAGVDVPDDPGTVQGDGTEEKPYIVSQVLSLGNPGSEAWVTGYIVGSAVDKTADSFTTATGSGASMTNIFIAQNAGETDYTKCVPVQLPSGDVRNALNLQQNAGNLGKAVTVKGTLEKYFGMNGVKNVASYKLEGGGDTPVTPPGPTTGDGSKEKPYGVTEVIGLNNPGTQAWVEGYIVGSAPGKSADTFTTEAGSTASNTNIFIAATPSETDYTKCVPVQLPAGDVRTALSIQANPGNLGKKVKLYGSLEKYFGMPGVKTVTEYELDGSSTGGDTPDTPAEADGSKEKPYSPSGVIALNNPGTKAWVKGYIVGSAPGKSADTFTTEAGSTASNTNIFIADKATETDYTKCIPVQLPAGDVRTALSIQANPGNLGKEVLLYGSLEKYFGIPGLKTVTEYELK